MFDPPSGDASSDAPSDPPGDPPYPFARGGWPLRPDICPCDLDFVDYLVAQNVRGKNIFHMGPGLHHRVGRDAAKLANRCTALTISLDEQLVYDLCFRRDDGRQRYVCLLRDIYDGFAPTAAQFDIVALFHLFEGNAIDDPRPRAVFDAFATCLPLGGIIALYTGSAAYDRVLDFPDEAPVPLVPLGTFRQLAVYYRPAAWAVPSWRRLAQDATNGGGGVP